MEHLQKVHSDVVFSGNFQDHKTTPETKSLTGFEPRHSYQNIKYSQNDVVRDWLEITLEHKKNNVL